MTPTQLEAAKRLLVLKKAPTNFLDYIKFRHPEWVIPSFHLTLIDILNKLEAGTLTNEKGEQVDNLIITMPPRHSKTTFSTIELPAYAMGRNPKRYIMTTSYNAELATDFGREVRNIVNTPSYRDIFPIVELAKDSQSASTWRTNHGGAYFGMGLGGSTSGRPANYLIIDDPYKNREDADSPTMRKKVWSYYQSALIPRLQPTDDGQTAKTLVIHTRWHPDDLIGRIMDTDEFREGAWLHVDFQGILHENTDHEEALWPSRFPLKRLQSLRRANPREFSSLYQQLPYIEGGNILKGSWWQYYPKEMKPEAFSTIIIPMDTAFKKGQGNDYTVAMPMGMTSDGDIFVLDVIRERMSFPELKQKAIQLNNIYRGKGLRAFYIEDKASGQSLIQELRTHAGISVIPYRNQDDKTQRAHSVAPIIQGGRVFLPENAPWLDTFLSEAEQFPDGSFDDIIDTLMIGIDVLSKTAASPSDVFEEGTSLLQEYNSTRDLIMGNKRHPLKSSLNQLTKSTFKWKGWGL